MISGRERRIAWIAGLAVGALALDSVIVRPLLARYDEAGGRVEVAERQLTTATQVFNNETRARQRWNEMAGDTLKDDASLAESQLLNYTRQWAQDAGLTLTSIKVERSETEQGYGKLTARAAGTGGMESLGRLLHAVQDTDIPVRIVDMSATSRRDGTDELLVQVGLSTIYLLPPEPAARGQTEVRR